MQIALIFIGAIVVVSLISRTLRSTELRAATVEFDDLALRFLTEAAAAGELRIIANHPDDRTPREYLLKEREEREASNIPAGDPVLFLEVTVADASEFAPVIRVLGQSIEGYRILRAEGSSVPNTIAAVLLDPGPDRLPTARLFRLDGGQPAQVPGAVHPVRRRGHRAGNA